MEIDDKSYCLTYNNFNEDFTVKKKIVIGNTFNEYMKHYIGWTLRNGGDYKKTSHFTILKNGDIFNHFDINYYSDYFNDNELNKDCVIVLLENQGQLLFNNQKNIITNIFNTIYNGNNVLKKRWRDYELWDNYTESQFNSLKNLVKYLTKKLDINIDIANHNTFIQKPKQTILYKSNLYKKYYDLNPSWDFKRFKKELEENE